MRIAFTLTGGSNWTGGHNYLLNLLDVLLRYQSAQLTSVLFMGEDCDETSAPFHAIKRLEIVHTPHLSARRRKTPLMQAMLWDRDATMQ